MLDETRIWLLLLPNNKNVDSELQSLQQQAEEYCVGSVIFAGERVAMHTAGLSRWIGHSTNCRFTLVTTPASDPYAQCKDIVNIPVQNLVWPIHGLTAAVHDQFVGLRGSFEETRLGLDELLKLQTPSALSLYIRTVITSANFLQLEQIASYLISFPIKGWLWEVPRRNPLQYLTETEQRRFVEIAKSAIDHGPTVILPKQLSGDPDWAVFGREGHELAASSLGCYPPNRQCRVPEHVTTIDIDGSRLLTCPWEADTAPDIQFDPKHSSVLETWNRRTFSTDRSAWCASSGHRCTGCQPISRLLQQQWKGVDSHSSVTSTQPSRLNSLTGGGIIIDWLCSASCAHCVFACDNHTHLPMSIALLGDLLRTIRPYLPGPRGLHISGGEPFLNTTRLVAALRVFRDEGVRCEFVETNGFWGGDLNSARDLLKGLKESGLERLRLSITPFHEPFIPPATSKMAYQAACDVLGAENVYLFDRHLMFAGLSNRVAFDICSGGRAGYMAASITGSLKSVSDFAKSCSYELLESGHVHFDGEGYIIPGNCSGIRLGHYSDIENYFVNIDLNEHPILHRLLLGGPKALWSFAESEFGISRPSQGFVGRCHCCVTVRQRIYGFNKFPELGPSTFYEAMDRASGREYDELRWNHEDSHIE